MDRADSKSSVGAEGTNNTQHQPQRDRQQHKKRGTRPPSMALVLSALDHLGTSTQDVVASMACWYGVWNSKFLNSFRSWRRTEAAERGRTRTREHTHIPLFRFRGHNETDPRDARLAPPVKKTPKSHQTKSWKRSHHLLFHGVLPRRTRRETKSLPLVTINRSTERTRSKLLTAWPGRSPFVTSL